jgi:hypothetical protein
MEAIKEVAAKRSSFSDLLFSILDGQSFPSR